MAHNRPYPRLIVSMAQPHQKPKEVLSLKALSLEHYAGLGLFPPTLDEYKGLYHLKSDLSHLANIETDIERLLFHVVYARQERRVAAVDPNNPIDDFKAIGELLDADPSLLFQAADVVTPAGLTVKRTTAYEAALGSGDSVMAEFIAGYLNRTQEGKAEKARSDDLYRPHLEQMLTRPPYDVNWLIDIMIHASDADVAAVLNKTEGHESALKDAIKKYQRETMPGEITVGMHYNYNNLIHLSAVYKKRFFELISSNPQAYPDTKFSRHKLFSRRIFGWEQGNLPACERFLFAQGNFSRDRTYKWMHSAGSFPVSRGACRSGLGDNFFSMYEQIAAEWNIRNLTPGFWETGRYNIHFEKKELYWENYLARMGPATIAPRV